MTFGGLARQRSFLNAFESMPPQGREALKDIYCHARHGDPTGRHVVLAMTSAARFPEIFRLVLMNIVTRMMIRHYERTGNTEKVAKLQETLEDFHVALDSFMNPSLSLDEAARRRQQRQNPQTYIKEETPNTSVPERATLDRNLEAGIQCFKQQAKPTVERIKAHNRKRIADPASH